MCINDKLELIKKYKCLSNKFEEERKEILLKLKDYNLVVKDNVTKSEVCFILSCPGEKELLANKVCAGQTGKNLDQIITYLNSFCSCIFPSLNRYDYNILNASNNVHFEELTNKPEEDDDIILSDKNIDRIKKFFKKNKNVKYLVFCGDKAKLLVGEIGKLGKFKIAIIKHVGLKGINRTIKEDVHNNKISTLPQNNRTKARLEVVALDIWEQINNN